MHRAVRSRRRQRGNALVELALLLPMMISLFLGTFSLGYSCYIYSELEAAVRTGARYASLATYDASSPTAFRNAVKNVVVYGNPAGGAQPLIPNLQTAQVNVSLSPSVGQPTSVTVSINGYRLFGMSFNTFALGNKPWIQIPFLGNYVPA